MLCTRVFLADAGTETTRAAGWIAANTRSVQGRVCILHSSDVQDRRDNFPLRLDLILCKLSRHTHLAGAYYCRRLLNGNVPSVIVRPPCVASIEAWRHCANNSRFFTAGRMASHARFHMHVSQTMPLAVRHVPPSPESARSNSLAEALAGYETYGQVVFRRQMFRAQPCFS